jgi:hypothetical protein
LEVKAAQMTGDLDRFTYKIVLGVAHKNRNAKMPVFREKIDERNIAISVVGTAAPGT